MDVELTKYLNSEKNKLNSEFSKYEATTTDLFEKVYDFFIFDFEELSDNRIYRHFLVSFKEIICFAFERDVSKVYMRSFFKIMNNDVIVRYLSKLAKSRATDIKHVMNSFAGFFVSTWQWCNNNKKEYLKKLSVR